MTDFILHPQLQADTVPVMDLDICRVLLMNDSNYPWVILVPMRANIREIFQLEPHEQTIVNSEVSRVSQALNDKFNADKMNIGALGNMVPQLHIHVIVRHKMDATFPAPVWGNATAIPYLDEELETMVGILREIIQP